MQNMIPRIPTIEELAFDPQKAAELKLEIGHIGINGQSMEEAHALARTFGFLFNLPVREVPGISYFADPLFECMGKKGLGANGHLCLLVDSVPDAMEYLASKGAKFLPDTRKFDKDGTVTFIYLEGEAGGFAIHLKKR